MICANHRALYKVSHPAPRPVPSLRSLSRPLPLSVPATVGDCGRLRPGAEARHARNKQPPVRLLGCVSLPSSAVLLAALPFAFRCALKGNKRQKKAAALLGSRSVAAESSLKRKAAAVSPSAFRFTRHLASSSALAPLRQVPHAAFPGTLRSAELGLPTASSPERQSATKAEKKKHLTVK